MSSKAVKQLIHAFSKLPGVGEKTATRFVFHLLRSPKITTDELKQGLESLHAQVMFCATCCNLTEMSPCGICQDPKRDNTTLCVVEEPSDVVVIERTAFFKGTYHVLHGALSPLEGIGPEDLKIHELLHRFERELPREIILATDANVEGDATALYLSQLLRPFKIKITRLSVGMPVGSELEFIDPSTLSKALEERREVL